MLKLKLWQQILVAMLLGLFLGMIARWSASAFALEFINGVLKPLGDMFITLLKMLVVPLIFCSLITGISSMEGNLGRMGRIGGRTFIFYLCTTAIAITLGLLLAQLMQAGQGLSLEIPALGTAEQKEVQGLLPTLMSTLQGIVPANPVQSLASGNILQIILFTLLLGIAINQSGEAGRPLRELFSSAATVVYTLTQMVMKVAPIGIFALMTWVAAKFGLQVLLPLLKLILTVYLACFLHAVFVMGSCVRFIAKIPLKRFFAATFEPLSFAFASTSSSATLPLTMNALTQKLGVSRRIGDFVLPLGATINMDGTAIYQGVCAVFIAQIYGIDLSLTQYVTIIFTCTLASIGTAGIPGGGLVMLSMVLSSVGLPLEGLLLIGGIDRILDMARTSVNVLGDCMVATVIARSENELQLDEKTPT